MKRYFLAALLGAAVFAAVSTPARVTRASMSTLERKLDRSVITLDPNQPGDILGTTRGVYLEGFGAVFSTEVELLPYAAPNPFKPDYTKAEIARLKSTKQVRLGTLRQRMREAMMNAASSLDSVPVNEQVAYAVTIPYWNWEDTGGMPRQILMQAPRAALLQGSRGNKQALDSAIKVQEF